MRVAIWVKNITPESRKSIEEGVLWMVEELFERRRGCRVAVVSGTGSTVLQKSGQSQPERTRFVSDVLTYAPPPPSSLSPAAIITRCDHVVIVFDGDFADCDLSSIPETATVHVICGPHRRAAIEDFAKATCGACVVGSPLSPASFRRAFEEGGLAGSGQPLTLAFGHLSAPISLAPDPLAALRRAKAASPSDFPTSFPQAFGIAGFLPAKLIPSPPSISAHVIIPESDATESGGKGDAVSPFISVLTRSLASERCSAVVAFGKTWRGLITAPFPVLPSANKSATQHCPLVLHVLRPGISLPGIGFLHQLPALSSVTLGGHHPVDIIPVVPDSALTGLRLSPSSDVVLRTALERFSKLAEALPQSQAELRLVYDTLVLAARAYHMPSILHLLFRCINSAISEAESQRPSTVAMLQEFRVRISALLSQQQGPTLC